MEPRKAMLGLLSYGAKPELACLHSILTTMPVAMLAGWHVSFSCRYGDSILPRARCSLLGEFVRSSHERLVMVDDDVSWKAEDFLRLINHDADLVGGVYPKKSDDVAYPALLKEGATIQPNGLIEVEGLPGGFMSLSKAGAERLVEAYSDRVYWDVASEIDCWALWDFGFKPEGWHGEDYRFCDRWKAIGGKVWADTEIKLGHTGKKTWAGDFGGWLRSREGTA